MSMTHAYADMAGLSTVYPQGHDEDESPPSYWKLQLSQPLHTDRVVMRTAGVMLGPSERGCQAA